MLNELVNRMKNKLGLYSPKLSSNSIWNFVLLDSRVVA